MAIDVEKLSDQELVTKLQFEPAAVVGPLVMQEAATRILKHEATKELLAKAASENVGRQKRIDELEAMVERLERDQLTLSAHLALTLQEVKEERARAESAEDTCEAKQELIYSLEAALSKKKETAIHEKAHEVQQAWQHWARRLVMDMTGVQIGGDAAHHRDQLSNAVQAWQRRLAAQDLKLKEWREWLIKTSGLSQSTWADGELKERFVQHFVVRIAEQAKTLEEYREELKAARQSRRNVEGIIGRFLMRVTDIHALYHGRTGDTVPMKEAKLHLVELHALLLDNPIASDASAAAKST